MCFGFYGWPETTNKVKTWRLLEAIARSIIKPWVWLGDFNEVMWNTKNKGGNLENNFHMGLFRNAVSKYRLRGMDFLGASFTWSNGRGGKENIQERLDRVLATSEWIELFPNRQVRHLPRYKSDHAPIVLECFVENDSKSNHKVPRRFQLEHMWL